VIKITKIKKKNNIYPGGPSGSNLAIKSVAADGEHLLLYIPE
jgi:hypothetical protein